MISSRFRPWLAIGLTALLALSTVRLASAHARLLHSNPEDGAVLKEAPREVYLWFDEAVAPEFSALDVLSADGQPVGSGALRGDPTDPTLLVATLPELTDGVYVLSWKVFSDIDSHDTRGTLVVGVRRAFDASARPASQVESPPPPLEVALRALNYATLSVLVGGLLVVTLILHPDRFEASLGDAVVAARRRAWRLALIATLMALVVGVAWLMWQANAIDQDPFGIMATTRFGALWLLRQAALSGAGVALLVAWRGRKWGWGAAGTLIVIVALSQALNSHAAGLIERPALAVVADTLHLLAAGAWVGSMFVLLFGLLPLLRSRRAELVQVALAGWRRFGVLAALSVGALAATGLYSMGRQIASIDAWIGTLYGQVLAGKSGLFIVAGLIGAANSILLHPRLAASLAAVLRRAPGWTPLGLKRLPGLLVAEAALAATVFVVSGALTATSPARGPQFNPPQTRVKPPSSLSLPVDDLLVALAIRPNKPGPNLIEVDALNTRRPPPSEIIRVLVRLRYRERDLGQQTMIAEPGEGGAYRINTDALNLAGDWQVEVVVRRKGIEDSIAIFDWVVESLAPSVPPRAVVISNAPIEPVLTFFAGLIAAVVVALATQGAWRGRRARARRKADHLSQSPVTFQAETRPTQ